MSLHTECEYHKTATLSFCVSWLIFPNFHPANKCIKQSHWLSRVHIPSLNTKRSLTYKIILAIILKITYSKVLPIRWTSCCSVLSDEALALVKVPQTVPPTSDNMSRTSRVSTLLWGGETPMKCIVKTLLLICCTIFLMQICVVAAVKSFDLNISRPNELSFSSHLVVTHPACKGL